MNAKQREEVVAIQEEIEALKSRVQVLCDDEEAKLDGLPENLQGGARADEFQRAVDVFTEVVESLETAGMVIGELAV